MEPITRYDLHDTIDLTPGGAVHHDLVIDVDFDGWDSESIGGDEHLGHVQETYNIDNLWGLLDGGEHTNKIDGEGITFDFSIRNPVVYDPTKFRENMFWSFSNFKTDTLSYAQFASTFSDVSPNEQVWIHPFNHLYYRPHTSTSPPMATALA